MKLHELLAGFIQINSEFNPEITGLQLNSRMIVAGELFFALPGKEHDGRQYIAQALERGASCVIYEPYPACEYIEQLTATQRQRAIPLTALQEKIGAIASRFYGDPSHDLTVIGVTGTSGKTSTSFLLAEILKSSGQNCGLIGTLGFSGKDSIIPLHNTTPDALTLQKLLHDFKNEGRHYVSMEASSHGLDQKRLNGVHFKYALFTNLTRDHLDYHPNIEHYQQAKKKLFEFESLIGAIVNIDDPFGAQLIQLLPKKLHRYAYTITDKSLDVDQLQMIRATDIELNNHGIKAKIQTPWGKGQLIAPLFGKFNLSNLLGIIALLGDLGWELKDILEALHDLPQVPGRMQRFGGGDKPLVIVDYAHKPDALTQVLMTVRQYCQGTLWCVVGCGGERDAGKRPMMGAISDQYSDQIILTDDNPRRESSMTIINDILKGIAHHNKVTIEPNRRIAIENTIAKASSEDIIVIAGKGHENYQVIGTSEFPFSDIEVVQEALQNKFS